MVNWKETIDVREEWKQVTDGTLTVQELAAAVAQKLATVNGMDSTLEWIMWDFELLAEDEDATEDEFDDIWERLYDWGDASHRLWIRATV